jgi:hypothetical protein
MLVVKLGVHLVENIFFSCFQVQEIQKRQQNWLKEREQHKKTETSGLYMSFHTENTTIIYLYIFIPVHVLSVQNTTIIYICTCIYTCTCTLCTKYYYYIPVYIPVHVLSIQKKGVLNEKLKDKLQTVYRINRAHAAW